MSVLGEKQTLDWRPLMSALPPKVDIAGRQLDVRFVSKADMTLRNPDVCFTPKSGHSVELFAESAAPWHAPYRRGPNSGIR
jgi:hypothetical protein